MANIKMITPVAEKRSMPAQQAPAGGSRRHAAWFALWGVLFLLLLAPATTTVYAELSKRSFNDNYIQYTTAVVGSIAAWRLSRSARTIPAASSMLGAVALAITSAVNSLAVLLHMATLWDISIIAMVGSFILAVRGPAKLQHYLPLILFSFFIVPDMPDELRLKISLPLQMITTKGSVALAHLFIPISSIGHTFIVNGHPFDVAPGCSGLNMWISFLFAFGIWQLIDRFRPHAYGIMAIGIGVLTMALNVVRLFITALVAYYISADQALAIHANLEAVLVPLGLLLLFYVGGRLRSAEKTTAA